MKFVSVLVVFVVLGVTSAVAQSESDGPGSVVTPADSTLLQSEEEIWEYLEGLCIRAPTRRCDDMQFLLVRDGVRLPMQEYDVDAAYHSKVELIEAARTAREGDQ
jgi:hypothetical protein